MPWTSIEKLRVLMKLSIGTEVQMFVLTPLQKDDCDPFRNLGFLNHELLHHHVSEYESEHKGKVEI